MASSRLGKSNRMECIQFTSLLRTRKPVLDSGKIFFLTYRRVHLWTQYLYMHEAACNMKNTLGTDSIWYNYRAFWCQRQGSRHQSLKSIFRFWVNPIWVLRFIFSQIWCGFTLTWWWWQTQISVGMFTLYQTESISTLDQQWTPK